MRRAVLPVFVVLALTVALVSWILSGPPAPTPTSRSGSERSEGREDEPGPAPSPAPISVPGGVSGRVVFDRAGNSISDIPVVARACGREAEISEVATISGQDGWYRFEKLPAGDWLVLAWGRGFVPRGLAGPTSTIGAIRVTVAAGVALRRDLMIARGGTIRGRVVDHEGRPVVGARIGVMLSGHLPDRVLRQAPGQAKSGADGGYLIDSIAPGVQLRVMATTDAGAIGVSPPVSVWAGEERSDLTVTLPRPRYAEVRVVSAGSGDPLSGARLRARWTLDKAVHVDSPREVVTDEEGRARIGPVPETMIRFDVRAPGFCIGLGTKAFLRENESSLTISLPRVGFYGGRVVFPNGAPLVGGRLSCFVRNELGGEAHWGDHDAIVDRDGRFAVAGVPSGPIRLSHTTVREGGVYELDHLTETGDNDLALTLRKRDGAVAEDNLEVRVLRADGGPAESGHWCDGYQRERLSNGLVKWPNLDRRDRLRLEIFGVEGSGPLRLDEIVTENRVLDVRLPPERVVTGIVIGPDDRPVEGARLSFLSAWKTKALRSPSELAHAEVVSDSSGRFRAESLGPWPYDIEVTPPSTHAFGSRLRLGPGLETVRIVLPTAVSIRVTVLNAAGEPVPGAPVTAKLPQDPKSRAPRSRAFTDVEGVAVLVGLDPSRPVALRVPAPAERGDVSGVVEKIGVPVDSTLQFEPGWRFSIRIVGRDGKAVKQAAVRWRLVSSHNWQQAQTDWMGGLEFGKLPADRIVLRATSRMEDPAAEDVPEHRIAAAHGVTTVTIDAGQELQVQILDWPTSREGMAYVCRAGHVAATRCAPDADGFATLDGLSFPCSILIRPTARGGGIDDRCVYFTGVVAGRRPVARLEPGLSIRGRLLFPGGTRKGMVMGLVHSPPHPALIGTLDREGNFEIRGFPPGTWTIRAMAGGKVEDVQVKAGSEVTIDLR